MRTLPWLLAFAAWPAAAADLLVQVQGVEAPLGRIGCALFPAAAGFPTDSTGARQLWVPAATEGVTCRFDGVAPGRYAVSVAHDRNGNGRVDTNLLGLPVEPWGVSNQVRPALRAPRFDEAAFEVAPGAAGQSLTVRVAP